MPPVIQSIQPGVCPYLCHLPASWWAVSSPWDSLTAAPNGAPWRPPWSCQWPSKGTTRHHRGIPVLVTRVEITSFLFFMKKSLCCWLLQTIHVPKSTWDPWRASGPLFKITPPHLSGGTVYLSCSIFLCCMYCQHRTLCCTYFSCLASLPAPTPRRKEAHKGVMGAVVFTLHPQNRNCARPATGPR